MVFASAIESPRSRRIVLVDDHPVIAHGVRAFLARLREHELHSVSTVVEAKAVLSSSAFDILIVDHDLRDECTGIELVRWLHRQVGSRAPRAILYTHRSFDDVWPNAQRHGFHAYVSKSSPPESLCKAIECVEVGDLFTDGQRIEPTGSLDYEVAGFRFNPSTGRYTLGDRNGELGPKTRQLFRHLLEANLAGQPWMKFSTLITLIWGIQGAEARENLTRLVSDLRRLLPPNVIRTKVGRFGACSSYAILEPVHKCTNWT